MKHIIFTIQGNTIPKKDIWNNIIHLGHYFLLPKEFYNLQQIPSYLQQIPKDNIKLFSNEDTFQLSQKWMKELNHSLNESYLFEFDSNWKLVLDKRWKNDKNQFYEQLIHDHYGIYYKSGDQKDGTEICLHKLSSTNKLSSINEQTLLENTYIVTPCLYIKKAIDESNDKTDDISKSTNQITQVNQLVKNNKWDSANQLLTKINPVNEYEELLKYIISIRILLHLNKIEEYTPPVEDIPEECIFMDHMNDIISAFRALGKNKQAYLWLKSLPTLCPNSHPWQFIYEMSIVGYYVSKYEGCIACNQLLMFHRFPERIRKNIENNCKFYNP